MFLCKFSRPSTSLAKNSMFHWADAVCSDSYNLKINRNLFSRVNMFNTMENLPVSITDLFPFGKFQSLVMKIHHLRNAFFLLKIHRLQSIHKIVGRFSDQALCSWSVTGTSTLQLVIFPNKHSAVGWFFELKHFAAGGFSLGGIIHRFKMNILKSLRKLFFQRRWLTIINSFVTIADLPISDCSVSN